MAHVLFLLFLHTRLTVKWLHLQSGCFNHRSCRDVQKRGNRGRHILGDITMFTALNKRNQILLRQDGVFCLSHCVLQYLFICRAQKSY